MIIYIRVLLLRSLLLQYPICKFVPILFIEFFVPAGEVAEAGAERGRGAEAEVAFEGCGVGVGDGDVTGLHGHEEFVSFEVVVGG